MNVLNIFSIYRVNNSLCLIYFAKDAED